MNGKFLLDTNVILGYLAGRPESTSFFNEHKGTNFYTSVISRIELLSFHGINPFEERKLLEILDRTSLLSLNAQVENIAILFRRTTRRKLPDSIVAASAIFIGATLVTSDKELAGTEYPGFKTIIP
jgi:predicted nucleic acid-binding protein